MTNSKFQETFNSLKEILVKYEKNLNITSDKKDTYNLNAGFSEKYKRDIYFGGVEIRKNYVSFHLMPVYVNPKLLEGISSELKRRMQGKSCFNFKKIDEKQVKELAKLIKRGYEYYKKAGLL
ncbi:MAG: DUF1801 domain-containing protein [Ignavibacteria bacterium]|nr:DUF1801 domain-containing protein [Ignavibacteria bacterium]